jgi:hypothetical protein
MPNRSGEVVIHLPEFTYLDTQVWSVDIGIPADALPALRAAIDAYGGRISEDAVARDEGASR